LAGGGHLVLGWRGFWLPLAGGVVWTAGSYSAFRASETTGIARAAGTWTPLNIIVAFAWGALLFGELKTFPGIRFVLAPIAQLSLLVNASIGIWAFRSPEPGTPAARKVIAGIVIAGAGGCVIGAMR
jgi:glucose uptake protein